MCRIGAIKSREPIAPSMALRLMLAQQEGYDNSGFAMTMQDLGGMFAPFKNKPLLSLACTPEGLALVEGYMAGQGFMQVARWLPEAHVKNPNTSMQAMPCYAFINYEYPETWRKRSSKDREELLVDTRLILREMLTAADAGYVYSFWPDVLTIKEIGHPADIAEYFGLWEDDGSLVARNIVAQCRQNTNYDIVRYAAHPFFLQGYTLCANGENTFFSRNTALQKGLHRAYMGFESDSQNFLYTLHYVVHELGWPLEYYKHAITPLPHDEVDNRPDSVALRLMRESISNLAIDGPNAIIALLPDGRLMTCCDAKKLRPLVVGGDENMMAVTSEVCGLNTIMPNRDTRKDIYPHGREMVVVSDDMEVSRWNQ
ncbi:MAG: glutamate synthase [Pseudomonadota bacterium]